MADRPTTLLDRFKHLEIPEHVRSVDWSFLDAPLGLPPIPLEPQPLWFALDGRVFVPEDADESSVTGDRVVFYERWHRLRELEPAAALEASWRQRNHEALAGLAKRFWDSAPAAVVREPALVAEAQRVLSTTSRTAVLAKLLGETRVCQLQGKLYDLATLREYVRIFEKAIDASLFAKLQATSPTAPPQELLSIIEGALDAVHAKARSPLRNKMTTCRAVIGGVTLLPLYREPSSGFHDAYRLLLERELKSTALEFRGKLA